MLISVQKSLYDNASLLLLNTEPSPVPTQCGLLSVLQLQICTRKSLMDVQLSTPFSQGPGQWGLGQLWGQLPAGSRENRLDPGGGTPGGGKPSRWG